MINDKIKRMVSKKSTRAREGIVISLLDVYLHEK